MSTESVYQSYFDKAELALAAYADFSEVPRAATGEYLSSRAKEALVKLKGLPFFEKEPDFSSTQADKFLERFDVLDQYTADPILNGFSATVFRTIIGDRPRFIMPINRTTIPLTPCPAAPAAHCQTRRYI